MVIIISMMIPFVQSVPPVTTAQQFTEGYEIRIPQDNILEVGQSYDFDFHIFNISNGHPINSGISCAFHLYDQTGHHLLFLQNPVQENVFDYSFDITGGNFSTAGTYYYNIQCNSSSLGGFHSTPLFVYPNGEEATSGKAIFYIGLLAVFLFFLAIGVYFMAESENLLVRVGSFGVSYILLVGITFIGWNMAKDFLTSAPMISEILRILFFVFMIGAFPILIGAFAWYVIMLFKIKEIDRLMTKGVSYKEAERRQGAKYK